jgi:hypothetical protein
MQEEYIQDQPQEVAWSMDDAQLQKISSLLGQANLHYIIGDYDKVAETLKACKGEFIHSLNSDERKSLKDLEKGMENKLITLRLQKKDDWKNDVSVSDKVVERIREFIIRNRGDLKLQVEDYREKIMDLLDKYGYLSKKKKDKTKMNY